MATTKTKAPVEGEVIAPERNAVTMTSVAPRVDEFIAAMLPSKTAKQVWQGLPEHIRPEVFKRNLYNALMANPELMKQPPVLVFREVSKAAGLGLLLDPVLGEAYIIIAYNGRSKKDEPQLRIGYKGMIRLARQSGNVAGIWCHDVHENDEVEADLGFPKRYTHKPVLFGERGKVIGYTAVIAYKDGLFDFEPMSLAECLAIRDRSDAWKASNKGTKFKTPWATDEGEMCKKTVFMRLMKRQDKQPELQRAIEIENEAEREPLEHGPHERLRAPAPPPDETDGATQSRDLSGERAKEIAKGKRTSRAKPKEEPKAPKAPEPPAEQEQVTEAVDDEEVPDIPKTAKELIEWVDKAAANIQTPEMLEHLRDLVTPRLIGMFPPDVDAIEAVLRQAERKIAP